MANDKKQGRLLFVLQYLMKNTDDDHTVSQQELLALCAESGHGGNRHTIGSDIDLLCSYGFDIIRSKEGTKIYYHYGCRDFDTAELRTLIDAVESSAFISQRKTECLIEKISGLASCHDAEKLRSNVYAGKIPKSDNNQIFLNIDAIGQAINMGRKISFQQYKYDGNRNRGLTQNGEVYTVSPYLTIWKDDRYYLVGWADNCEGLRSFRIDRIASVTVLAEPAVKQPEEFDPYIYHHTLTRMCGEGPEMDVSLICEDSMMDCVLDRFGSDFDFARLDIRHFRATVHVNVSSTFLSWVFEHSGKMKIEGPEAAKQMYYDQLALAQAV